MKQTRLLRTLLVALCLLTGTTSLWADAITTHSWTFAGSASDTELTASSTSLTAASTTCYLGTAPSCCEGLYFQGKWKVYSGTATNSGIRNIDSGDRMIIVPNLKKGDIITITGNDDAINNINTTPSAGTKDEVKKTLTFTMSADGNFYFKMVKAQTIYPAIKSIVVTHNYAKAYSADFQDVETYTNGWTINSNLYYSQGTCTATSSKTLYIKNLEGSNYVFSYTYNDATITNAGSNNYIYEFDFNYGQCNKNATGSTLTIQSNNEVQKLFTLDKISEAWKSDFNISNSSGTVLTETALAGGPYNNSVFPSLYHFKVEGIQDDGVYLTVTSGSTTSLARTKVADFAPVTGIYSNMGKNATAVAFDNIVYYIDIASLKNRTSAAIDTYNNIKNEVMNSTTKTALDAAYSTLNTDFNTDEKIYADFNGYNTAVEALENAVSSAQESVNIFIILNALISNAAAIDGYSAPEGASTVYSANADVDPAALATDVKAAIISAGTVTANTNITALIVNSGFELGNTLGWTIDGDPATGGTDADNNGSVVTTDVISGNYTYYTGWKGRNINQKIVGLPAGSYKLTAKARSWTNGDWRCTVALVANGGASDPVTMEGSNTDLEYTFAVTGNEEYVNIGIAGTNGATSPYPNGGDWGYYCDEFTLTYVGQDPVALAKASLVAEIATATTLKNSWTPKVGNAPFKYDATNYNALVTEIATAQGVVDADGDDADTYTAAETALETAESNMESSTQNAPDANKYYRIFVANNDGTASDYNLNLVKGKIAQVTVTSVPYPVKFVADGARYYIKTPYDNALCTNGNGTDAYTNNNITDGFQARCTTIAISLNENGSVKLGGYRSSTQTQYYSASATEGSGVTAKTGNTGTWVVSDAVDVTDVTLSVNATAGWGTFIAPYDNLIPENVKAYTVEGKNNTGTSISLTENETGILTANTPYVLSTTAAENVSFAFKGIATNDADSYEVNGLVGLLTAGSVPANSYVLQYQANADGTAFYKTANGMNGTANRCYLNLANVGATAGAHASVNFLVFGDDVTGINAVNASKNIFNGSGVIYNINGQRVSNPIKGGLYIVNGMKYTAK